MLISLILAVHQSPNREAGNQRTEGDCFSLFAFLSSIHPSHTNSCLSLSHVYFSIHRFPPTTFPFLPLFIASFLCPLMVFNLAYLPASLCIAHPLLILMLFSVFFLSVLPSPKFLQPSPDSLHTSVLTFITLCCTDKRISLLRLHQSCHVRSVKIRKGGLGRRKCLKVSHKNSFIH